MAVLKFELDHLKAIFASPKEPSFQLRSIDSDENLEGPFSGSQPNSICESGVS